jgi:HAD superfamily hydrolase (TIGR01459 family)
MFSSPTLSLPELLHTHHPRALLLDAFGVFWQGETGASAGPYPGAASAMRWLKEQGCLVGVLSNASAPAAWEIAKVGHFGLHQGVHFDFYLTSGEVARSWLQNLGEGKRCFEIGSPHPGYRVAHRQLFDEVGIALADHLEEADFVIAHIPHQHGQDIDDPELFRAQLEQPLRAGLPMLCLNPDRMVCVGETMAVRQGALAALYREMGGKVWMIGKPFPEVYGAAMAEFERLGIQDPAHVFMVGDTPETDLLGARAFGMGTVLVTQTGIFAARSGEHWEQALNTLPNEQRPHILLHSLSLAPNRSAEQIERR